jgi:peptidyl-prolyl cis-trans isomerase C
MGDPCRVVSISAEEGVRMNRRNWIMRGLAGAVLAWLSGGTVPARAQQPAAGPAAAVVNGEPIPMAEVEAILKQTPSAVQVSESVQKEMRLRALAMLVDDTLMQQYLKANAPQVSRAEVEAKMVEMDASLRKQNKNIEMYCKENGQTVDQMRDGLLWMLRWAAWTKVNIHDADLERYYKEYKEFFDGAAVRASHIVLRIPANATEADKAKLKATLMEWRAQLMAGKMDFATAAKTYSQCDSAKSGGDLGFFPRKMMYDEQFSRAAYALQPGQISEVVQTDFGLHLIYVTERKPGKPSEFAKVKDQVREFYAEDVRLTILAQQRQAAKIQVNIQ